MRARFFKAKNGASISGAELEGVHDGHRAATRGWWEGEIGEASHDARGGSAIVLECGASVLRRSDVALGPNHELGRDRAVQVRAMGECRPIAEGETAKILADDAVHQLGSQSAFHGGGAHAYLDARIRAPAASTKVSTRAKLSQFARAPTWVFQRKALQPRWLGACYRSTQ